jgi:hypothetical protein
LHTQHSSVSGFRVAIWQPKPAHPHALPGDGGFATQAGVTWTAWLKGPFTWKNAAQQATANGTFLQPIGPT